MAILFAVAPITARADSDFPKKEKVTYAISYFPQIHRYVNNYKIYYPDRMKKVVANINTAIEKLDPGLPSYLYLVESSRTHPMTERFEEDSEIYRFLKASLHVKESDHLKFSTFDQFCEFFYSTDHHWNDKGSYQGYQDIVRMILGESETILIPEERVELPIIYNGSYASKLNQSVSDEHFTLYRFDDLPEYTSFINGKKRVFDHVNSYLEGKYSTETFANHYQLCYGGNYPLVVLETEQEDKMNLLMLCNSMGVPIAPLLAAHYNRIVCVNPRYYEGKYGKPLSLKEAVQEYDIDQLLIVGDAQFFVDCGGVKP